MMYDRALVSALEANGGPLAGAAAREIERLAAMAQQRTQASHNHQWAELSDLWQSLPERLADMPYAHSPEALRKHALIATGYADCTTVDAGSKAAAERVAATLAPLATRAHGYAIVKTEGPMVRVWTPVSQSYRAMGKAAFNESKEAVLAWVRDLVGVGE